MSDCVLNDTLLETKKQNISLNKSIVSTVFDNKIKFIPQYCRKNGALFCVDSIEFLKSIKSESIDVVFADPPYNIKKVLYNKD